MEPFPVSGEQVQDRRRNKRRPRGKVCVYAERIGRPEARDRNLYND
jgi:hypothetical protein